MQAKRDKGPKRYFVIFVVMLMAGVYILGKALYTMLPPESDYWKAVGLNNKQGQIPASRGNILSCDRQVLSGTVPKYNLYLDFAVHDPDSTIEAKTRAFRDSAFRVDLDSIAEGLARIFPDYDKQWFRQNLLKGKSHGKYAWRIYPKQASYVQYKACKELPFLRESMYRSGFHADEILHRLKPYGELAARTIGDLYKDDSSRAKCGLELSFDSILRGKPGSKHFTVVRNRLVPIIDKQAENGHDLLTTIDINIQDFADRALRNKMKEEDVQGEVGVAIVMEVKTGDVKAIVNLTRGQDGKYYELKNNAVSDLWEPGSTFKTASIMVALEDGKINLNKTVDCTPGAVRMHGRWMKDHNWRKGGYKTPLKVEDILGQSSNIGVSKIIEEAYSNDPSAFVDGLYREGVGIPLDLPFVGKGEPIVPHPRDKKHYWSKSDLPWMSIGYVTMLPPISTLTFYNAIANGGRMMRPRFVTAELKDGMVIKEFPPEVIKERICSSSTLRDIQYCREHVVSGGLGKKAGNGGKYFKVSGKTGTAMFSENGRYGRKHMVSFCGYFPSDNPKYSCIVCIRHQQAIPSGGVQCGPVFREISEYIMSRDSLRNASLAADTNSVFVPKATKGNRHDAEAIVEGMGLQKRQLNVEEADTMPLSKVPDVTGMGVKDAVYALQKRGLRVRVNGCGQIAAQDIAAGSQAVKGKTVTLTTTIR